jgi:tetratricopeptide (TPR) repeat protein
MWWKAFNLACLLFAGCAAAISQEDLGRLYAEAQAAQNAGDLATAARKYEAIVRLRPDMAEAHSNLGNLYYQQGDAARAGAAYRKAIQLKPQLAGPHFFLGVIAFNQHDYAAALSHLSRASRLDSRNALISSYLGYTQYARGSYAEAAAALENAAEIEGRNIDVLYMLGKSYGHLAGEAYTLLQKKFPEAAYTYLARAHFFEAEQNWKSAAGQYGMALEKLPGNARLREKQAEMAARSPAKPEIANPARSDDLVDGSLAYLYAPPAGPRIAQEIAVRRARIGSLKPAGPDPDRRLYLTAESYQILSYLAGLQVFEIDPQSYRAHQIRAQLLETSGKDEEAVAEYRRALELKPDLQNVHFAIGSLYWKDRRLEEARVELEEELRLNPNHPQALYELGDILTGAGKAREAEAHFRKAVKLEPKMAEAHFALEKIYTQNGQYQQAVDQLRKALEIDPSDPTPHYRLASIYRKMGRNQEAEEELKIFSRQRTARDKPE